jgi:hypothetical protein
MSNQIVNADAIGAGDAKDRSVGAVLMLGMDMMTGVVPKALQQGAGFFGGSWCTNQGVSTAIKEIILYIQ